MTVISGSYTGTHKTLAIGNTLSGFRHSYQYRGRTINFDALGETPVDTILAGLTMSLDFVAQEYDAAAIDSLRWPFNAAIGQMDVAGASIWALAGPTVLTSCLTGVDPQTITFYKTLLAPDFPLDIDYSHKERPLPMRLIVLPVKFDAGGDYSTPEMPTGCTDVVFFSETNWI